jgi:hypothetical protein
VSTQPIRLTSSGSAAIAGTDLDSKPVRLDILLFGPGFSGREEDRSPGR